MKLQEYALAAIIGCLIGATVNSLARPVQRNNAYLDGQTHVYKEAIELGYGNFDNEGNWEWYPSQSGRMSLIERDKCITPPTK